MSRFIILCGGTGGHLAPGIAIGTALLEAGNEVEFVTSKKQVDSRLMKKYPELKVIKSPGVGFSANPIRAAKFFWELALGIILGIKKLKSGKCDAVVSFGGFNSLGFSLAAALLGVPLVLHEANRKPGKATRLLGRFAERIYVPYGVEISRRKIGLVKNAGYPVRSEIGKRDSAKSKEMFGFAPKSNVLLVLGGSQGAQVLNEWARDNFPKLAKIGIDVLCVTGPGKDKFSDSEEKDAKGFTRKIKFLEFCDNMAFAMSAATVVVARAGAGSIAEFARCSLPAILVPYPYAANNHQSENAKCFERQGACVVVSQNKLNTLLDEVEELFSNANLRRNMKKNLERVDELNDMSKIVSDLEKIAERKHES